MMRCSVVRTSAVTRSSSGAGRTNATTAVVPGAGMAVHPLARHLATRHRIATGATGLLVIALGLLLAVPAVSAERPALALFAAAVLGAGYGLTLTYALTEAATVAPPERLARVGSLVWTLAYLGMFAPYVVTLLSGTFAVPSLLGAGALLAVLCCAVLTALNRRDQDSSGRFRQDDRRADPEGHSPTAADGRRHHRATGPPQFGRAAAPIPGVGPMRCDHYADDMADTPLSALEVAVVQADTRAVDTLRDTAAFAQELERLGYGRIWYAEHHHSPAIGAFPPVVLAAHAAASTSVIRLGSGGVLAPNHAPLMLAEQFGTLAALHENRIDFGIGRGPGTFDEATARALRRGAGPTTDAEYRDDIAAILSYLVDEVALGPLPEPWLLASSTSGATLAAELGLPVALAHHIRPDNTHAALDRYRAAFTPSRWSERPRVLVCVETICAETEEEAARLAGPMDVVKAGLLKGASEIPFPTPAQAGAHTFTAQERQALAGFRAQQATGTPETVVRRLTQLADETGADELMLTTPVYDFRDRVRSYELVMKNS